MNKTARRQMAKGNAFNAILKMFHPKAHWKAGQYNRESSYREQIDSEVEWIMEQYFKELKRINSNEPILET